MSHRHVTWYDLETGRITTRQRLTLDEEPYERAGEGWIWGRHDASVERVDISTGKAVPLQEVEITVTGNRIEGVPAGARVTIAGQNFEATGKPIEITADFAEAALLRIGHELHLHTDRTIELDPSANPAKASKKSQHVQLEQNPTLMRLRHYRDGDTLDALCKAMGVLLDAHPEINDPGVTEMREILAHRADVKTRLPKRERNR